MNKMLPPLTLVLGGAASGKSVFAENLTENSGLKPVYVATARIWDEETNHKVFLHRDRRGPQWQVVEAPLDLAVPLAERHAGEVVLLDCLTMWLTNLIMDENDPEAATDALCTALASCPVPVVIVTNEVGQGIVPDNALARRFREAQGRLNMRVAAMSDLVVQVVAGLPNVLKGALP